MYGVLRTRLLGVSVLCAITWASLASVAEAGDGDRPRNVAQTPDGGTIIMTSEGSTKVTQARVDQAPPAISYIEVGAKSWGVCAVDTNTVVVTHVDGDYVTVLSRANPSQSFSTVTQISATQAGLAAGALRFSTEVIKSPRTPGRRVFVANRGKPPAAATGANAWKHAVYEINIDTQLVTATYVTEREPRALLVAPSSRLFVGHVQGALGGTGIANNNSLANKPFDGGSVVVFNISTGAAVRRFAIGSPVRSLALWPPPGATPNPFPTTYRVFVTHVGDGAQSEAPRGSGIDPSASVDPGFGGRAIPNAITSIKFNLSGTPLSRQDVVFRHNPDLDDTVLPGSSANLPAVLPENIAIRWDYDEGTESYSYELYVTHSASGTVSRAILDSIDGAIIDTEATINVTQSPGEQFSVVTGRSATDKWIQSGNITPATTSNATLQFGVIDAPAHGYIGLSTTGPGLFSSVPRDIVFDPQRDVLWVAAQFDHLLAKVIPGTMSVSQWEVGSGTVEEDERDFFTFGRGFDFREQGGGASPKVNNLACVTCHHDGHLDGKVRFTVREGVNMVSPSTQRTKPVTVPSVFDAHFTEWLFFEGLTTIRDFDDAVPPNCFACREAKFFENTRKFRPSTPASPFAPIGAIAGDQVWGRYHFQKMNCTRCHHGPSSDAAGAVTFRRSDSPTALPGPDPESPGFVNRCGPLPTSPLQTENRYLHELSQIFVFNVNDLIEDALRNMTNVGTRPSQDGRVNGINTPALAGAWDAAPYMHDGRYRLLDEVIANTWLREPTRVIPVLGDVPPDNLFDGLLEPAFGCGEGEDLEPVPNPSLSSKWGIHKHGSGPTGNYGTVTQLLTDTEESQLISFIRAASSQTDLCPPLTVIIADPSELQCSPCAQTFNWTTEIPMPCTVEYRELPSGAWLAANPATTPAGLNHTADVQVVSDTNYELRITIDMGAWPQADMPVCRERTLVFKQWNSGGPEALQSKLEVAFATPKSQKAELSFVLGHREHVLLRIVDVRGRLVQTLVDNALAVGRHSIAWERDDHHGGRVASGVYLAVLEVADKREAAKIVVLE